MVNLVMNSVSHLKDTPKHNCGSCTNLRNPIKDFANCNLNFERCVFGKEAISMVMKSRGLILAQLPLLKEEIGRAHV